VEETGRSVSGDTDDAPPVDATRSAPPSKLRDQQRHRPTIHREMPIVSLWRDLRDCVAARSQIG
jgi:hypothetical protein